MDFHDQPEVVGDAHRAGRVAGHRVDAAVRRAGPDRHDRGRLACQPVQPLGRLDRLARRRVGTEPRPVPLGLDRLVRDRPLDDEDERLELAAVGLVPPLDERVGPLLRPALEVDQRPVHLDLRQPRQGAHDDLLDARLGRPRQGDGVAVAPQPTVHPEDVEGSRLGLRRCLGLRRGGHRPSALLSSHTADRKVRARPAETRVDVSPGWRAPTARWTFEHMAGSPTAPAREPGENRVSPGFADSTTHPVTAPQEAAVASSG